MAYYGNLSDNADVRSSDNSIQCRARPGSHPLKMGRVVGANDSRAAWRRTAGASSNMHQARFCKEAQNERTSTVRNMERIGG